VTAPERDRDAAGRARNARPRDAAGRPLARQAAGTPRVPEDLVLPPDPALAEAQRLLDAGLPFHAHEVLEATWKAAPAAQRSLWQGLAQLAVGLTHLQRGNRVGAVSLLRRGAERISAYAPSPPHGIAAAELCAWALKLADALAADQADTAAALLERRPGLVR
jgi:hypothetical protein